MRKLNPKWITKSQRDRLYQLPVPVIGLTGGIATGKSTVAGLLKARGYALIDADSLVKNIYSTEESLSFIQQEFPDALIAGKIDFKSLRALVFNHPTNQKKIENYIYARLPAEFMNTFMLLGKPEFVIYDVPLLFEKKLNEKVDVSICVYCPRAMQKERLINRDHISSELAEKILARQFDIEEKRRVSDLVIVNEKGHDALEAAIIDLLENLHQLS